MTEKYEAWKAVEDETKTRTVKKLKDSDKIIELVGNLEGISEDADMGIDFENKDRRFQF